jgi:methyl-accepting chemotaxis protein
LNQTTQQNASSSEELAATSEEMSSQAEQLQHTMSFFKVEGGGGAIVHRTQTRKPAFIAKPSARKTGSAKPVATIASTDAGSDIDESKFSKF